MSDITDRTRKPLVDRAKDWCADAQVAHTCKPDIFAKTYEAVP